MAASSLRQRILSALVMAPVFLGLMYLGGIPFAVTIAVAAVISIYEWVRMAQKGTRFWFDVLIGVSYLLVANFSFIVLRNYFDNGLVFIFGLLFCVWACDIGAYFSGKAIGGPKMAPAISPNKTWAGLIGGMFFSGLILMLYSYLTKMSDAPLIVEFLTGAALGGVGQIGDLFISAMKRRVGVKDTGNLIPGHGGLLDRIDSLLLASPAFMMACLLWL